MVLIEKRFPIPDLDLTLPGLNILLWRIDRWQFTGQWNIRKVSRGTSEKAPHKVADSAGGTFPLLLFLLQRFVDKKTETWAAIEPHWGIFSTEATEWGVEQKDRRLSLMTQILFLPPNVHYVREKVISLNCFSRYLLYVATSFTWSITNMVMQVKKLNSKTSIWRLIQDINAKDYTWQ